MDNGKFNRDLRFSQMRRFFVVIIVLFWLSALAFPPRLCAHEFDDGHVERSIDVIIRNRKLQLTYAIGLSDETIVEWLAQEGVIEEAKATWFRKQIETFESTLDKVSEAVSEDLNKKKSDVPPPKPLEFQSELSSLLQEKLSQAIVSKFNLTLNGAPLKFENKSAASPRHHVRLEIVLTATIPNCTNAALTFSDGNFLQHALSTANPAPKRPIHGASGELPIKPKNDRSNQDQLFRYTGAVRKAIRVKGSAILLSSNSVPVLTRAKPIDIGSGDLAQRTEAATITSKITFADARNR